MDLAKIIANAIATLYPEGTKNNCCKWKGDSGLDVNQSFALIDRFGDESQCQCTYVKNIVDNGYRQEIKAKKLPILSVP